MKSTMVMFYRNKGFTLVEMAVVLVIMGLLISAFLAPLTAQRDLNDYSKVRTDIEQIKEALYGYAIVNGSLPCPDATGDGIADACGTTLNTASTGGNLPWLTLGVQGNDPWNNPYQYRVNDAFGTAFSLATEGTATGILKVCTDNTCVSAVANNVPAVIYTSGKNGAMQPPTSADELENTRVAGTATFDSIFVSHEFNADFDDIVDWISPHVLFNRMVTAERLP